MVATVTWVESGRNKADKLTRVSRRWLQAAASCCATVSDSGAALIRRVHERNHQGIDRTLYLARLSDPSVSRVQVAEVIKGCSRCSSIDLAPVQWEKGSLGVDEDWRRINPALTPKIAPTTVMRDIYSNRLLWMSHITVVGAI